MERSDGAPSIAIAAADRGVIRSISSVRLIVLTRPSISASLARPGMGPKTSPLPVWRVVVRSDG